MLLSEGAGRRRGALPQSSERATSAVTVPGTALPALREFDAKIRGEYPAPAVVWKGDAGRKITGAYFQRAFFGPRPDQRSQIAGKEPPDPLIGFPDDLGRQVLRDVQRRALFQHQGHFLAQQTADQFLDSGRRRGRTRRRIQYRMHHQRYVRLARIVGPHQHRDRLDRDLAGHDGAEIADFQIQSAPGVGFVSLARRRGRRLAANI